MTFLKFHFFNFFQGHTSYLWTITFSSDETRLVSSGSDKYVCLWDTETGEKLNTIEIFATVWDVSFSPDSAYFAVATSNGKIKIIDTLTCHV